MKFLDDLRAYLERPEPPRPAFVPDVAAHRKHLLDALEQAERKGLDAKAVRQQLKYWSNDRLQQYVHALGRALTMSLAHGALPTEVERLINIAIDRELDLDTSTGSRAKDAELDNLRHHALHKDQGEPTASRYALELRAVRRAGTTRVVTSIGKLILELPDKDAVRWLLAAEVVQSRGPRDEWRLSSDAAASLLQNPEGARDWDDEDPPPWPIEQGALLRLFGLGLVAIEYHAIPVDDYADREVTTYKVLPEGRRALEEIASGRDTPFMLLARALLQDETASVLAQYPAAAAMVRSQNATVIAIRHARMVAHEIRNTLVPVRARLSMFYDEMEQQGHAGLLGKHRERIDAGIERLFDFVQDNAEIAHLLDAPADTFDLVPAIESAIAAVAPESTIPISFAPEAKLPPVIGHRERFTMALANIMRNAAQARAEPPVTIRVTAGLHNGAAVFVQVDDDGPGIAPEDRTNIFSPGFSRRAGGSGQGLAFAREVVEGEMAGRVAYEESPLGGARFTLRLPVGTRRSA